MLKSRVAARALHLLSALLLLCSSAVAGDVKTFPAKNNDISRYETYQWFPIRILTKVGIKEDDPDISPIIKAAITRELALKGYKEVTAGGQLHLLSMGLSAASHQLEGFLIGWGWEPGWGWAPSTSTAISHVNREGTIAVGLVDAQTRKPVWSGFATEAMGKDLTTIDKTINKATSRLFKKLPARK